MEEYLRLFQTEAEFDLERQNNYSEPWVSYIEGIDRVDYNKTEDEKIIGTPFTVESLGSGNVTWSLSSKTAQYSKNGGEWTSITGSVSIPVVAGDKVAFKGTNSSYQNSTLNSTSQFNVMGNIMSLTAGDGFATAATIENPSAFTAFFSGATTLVSAEKLKLPATTLANSCYRGMFQGCTSLTTAPELPATTLENYCYHTMFSGCTSLTTAPSLPAGTLANHCYDGMFSGCNSLTTAPALPATELQPYCYAHIFSGCTSLTTAPSLSANTLANYSCLFMFGGCTALTTVPYSLPATTETYCYANMFNGCTSLTTPPELPATTLAQNCYGNMFNGCSSLSYIKAMFTTEPNTTRTRDWVNGVASTGTFVKNASASWTTTGVNGIPTGWRVETASA